MNEQEYQINFDIKAKRLKDFLNTVNDIQENARLSIDNEKWKIVESDPVNVIAVDTTMDAMAFNEYKMPEDNEQNIEAGLDVIKLLNILKMSDNDYNIQINFKYNQKDENRYIELMELNFANLQFVMKTIDIDTLQKRFEPPVLDPIANVILDKRDFNIALNAPLKIGARYIYFTLTDEALVFSSNADFDSSSAEYKIDKDMLIGYEKQAEGKEIKSLYTIEYLDKIKKSLMSSSSREIKLEFGNNYPLRATFNFSNEHVEAEFYEAIYYLAPRIEE